MHIIASTLLLFLTLKLPQNYGGQTVHTPVGHANSIFNQLKNSKRGEFYLFFGVNIIEN